MGYIKNELIALCDKLTFHCVKYCELDIIDDFYLYPELENISVPGSCDELFKYDQYISELVYDCIFDLLTNGTRRDILNFYYNIYTSSKYYNTWALNEFKSIIRCYPEIINIIWRR